MRCSRHAAGVRGGTQQLHDVDLDARQDALYATMVEELEDALGGDDKDRAELLGMLAKLAVVAIHADGLGTSWKAGWKTPDPESPKFRACVDDILRSPGCNHIVFLEHLGCQRLLGRYLESRGIPARKIAFLNGEAASSLVKRQRIADAFNAGQYKVLVCNKIAEQGLDLQQRTCGVHHLDLPWEPASLRQRNGRGLRQGNESPSVGIRYYLARRSLDGLRYTTIEGKRGWQDALLTSTDRRVENMGAQQDLSADDILYMVTRDPEKTRALLEERKAAAEAKRVAKVRKHANTLLRRLAQRHRLIERAANAERASVFRADAKRFELELSRVSAVDWPFHHLVDVARTRHVFVPEEGVPIYEGQRLALKGTAEGQVDFVEIGRIGDEEFGVRAPGAATPNWWKGTRRFDVLKTWQPVVPMPPWPVSEAEEARVRSEATPSWRDLKWATAATAAELAPRAKGQALRIDSRGRAVFAVYGDVIPPTQEGFDLFVQLFRDRQIGLKSYQVAGAVKEHWFGRFEWT
jgi:superfamily II DNA/RNA helicase